ncbi:hypothetical protein FQN55_006973 [Onygenales sp. PD_40]|nr:hypothetical protein FQN55_006973 [Onygenales sp. PD_40]
MDPNVIDQALLDDDWMRNGRRGKARGVRGGPEQEEEEEWEQESNQDQGQDRSREPEQGSSLAIGAWQKVLQFWDCLWAPDQYVGVCRESFAEKKEKEKSLKKRRSEAEAWEAAH